MVETNILKWLEVRKATSPELIPNRSALLVVDMQEYQVRKEWPVYKSAQTLVPGMLDYFVKQTATVAEPNIIKLIDFFRAHNLRIIYTMYSSFAKDGSDMPPKVQEINRAVPEKYGDRLFPHKDHPGSKIIESLKPEEGDLVVVKNTSNVFTSTKLEFVLKNMGIEQLLVTGVVTNMCVEGAARTAAEIGLDVFLIDDACAAWSPQMHIHTLQSFGLFFGWVMTTDEAMIELRKKMK
ncbi:MAG: cysteine hydrolase [Deltaproteobacteria bacterium]|nr:cysteine hydrolase [Deltaproteobacteria bacterium]